MSSIIILQPDELDAIIERAVRSAVRQLSAETHRSHVPEYMDKKALADHLSVSVSTIGRMMRAGMPYSTASGSPRFRTADVDLWMRTEGHRNVISINKRKAA